MAEEPEVDPIPWFIQAPAEHSAEVARTLAYQAISGKEGIARAGDLTVQALPVPGGAVQVLPGAAGILNRDQGGGGQAYIGRVGKAANVSIAATGSGSGRSDLIVFRVSDPQYGGAAPDDKVKGPYIFLDVVSGVNSDITRMQDVSGHEYDSAVTLARVDLPASTGTVTDAMITNLAKVANPYFLDVWEVASPTTNQDFTATSWARWITPAEWDVTIPEFASAVFVDLDVLNPIHMDSDTYGEIGAFINGVQAATGAFANEWNGVQQRLPAFSSGKYQIPEALRGTTQKVDLRARRLSASGRLRADTKTRIRLKMRFVEE